MRKILLGVLVAFLLVALVRGRAPLAASTALSREEVEYIRAVKELRADYIFFTEHLRFYLGSLKGGSEDASLLLGVDAALMGWEVAGKRVRALEPPAGYEDLHWELVEVSLRYDRCARLTREGFGFDGGEVNIQKIEEATAEAEVIKGIWQELDPKLNALFEKLPSEGLPSGVPEQSLWRNA